MLNLALTCPENSDVGLSNLLSYFSGANTGIGKETVLDLVKRGARVILLCRNEEKAKKAIQDIKSLHKDAKLSIIQLDLGMISYEMSIITILVISTFSI